MTVVVMETGMEFGERDDGGMVQEETIVPWRRTQRPHSTQISHRHTEKLLGNNL